MAVGNREAVVWQRRKGRFRQRRTLLLPGTAVEHVRMIARGNRFRFQVSSDGATWRGVGRGYLRGPIEESARFALTVGGERRDERAVHLGDARGVGASAASGRCRSRCGSGRALRAAPRDTGTPPGALTEKKRPRLRLTRTVRLPTRKRTTPPLAYCGRWVRSTSRTAPGYWSPTATRPGRAGTGTTCSAPVPDTRKVRDASR